MSDWDDLDEHTLYGLTPDELADLEDEEDYDDWDSEDDDWNDEE